MADEVAPLPARAGQGRDLILGRLGQRVALAVLVVGIWWVAALGTPEYVFPGPAAVWDSLARLAGEGVLFEHIAITFYRVVGGFLMAAVVGVPLGVLLGASRGLGSFLEPVLTIIAAVSSTCWAILAVIWFGLSDATPMFVVFMTALPLVATNVWQGTRNVSWEWLELARAMQLGRARTFTKIYVPSILPYFYSASRLALGFGWRVSLVAEALGAGSGVGYMILRAADLVQTAQVFAWTIAVVATMLLIEGLFIRPTESWLFRWKKQAES